MRLFGSKIPSLTNDLIAHLRQEELVDILPANVNEVELDVESVLKEYLRTETPNRRGKGHRSFKGSRLQCTLKDQTTTRRTAQIWSL